MSWYIIPGMLGLLLGLTLRWTRLCQPAGLQRALAFRVSHELRSLLFAIGAGMALTALLCWLAVIDVDGIAVLPLSAGALAGGALFGAAAALCGYTPLTAFTSVGCGPRLEALCVLAGCLAGTLLLPLLKTPLDMLQALPPQSATTLFAVTLDEPYLLGGGFLGQGCAGLLLMTIAVCIPSNRQSPLQEEPSVPEKSADAPSEEAPSPVDDPADDMSLLPAPPPLLLLPAPSEAAEESTQPEGEEDPAPPDAAPEETFIALLPGEEPLVVDTALDEEPPAGIPSETDPPDPEK